METILVTVTIIVTFICGRICKKSIWVCNNLIPIQNLLIGAISSFIYYIVTGNFSLAIATGGLFAGGVYDISRNLQKLFLTEKEPVDDIEGKG